jgi:hypothetical protein
MTNRGNQRITKRLLAVAPLGEHIIIFVAQVHIIDMHEHPLFGTAAAAITLT